MKFIKVLLTLSAITFTCGVAQADEAKPEGTPAKCCAKAASDGKECAHACCVTAMKDGKQCEKCGGKNEKKA